MFRLQDTKLLMSTTYHPKTDGQTKVPNKILEIYLRCFISEQPKSWNYILPWVEYWYNTSYQDSMKCMPFEVVYGRSPPYLPQFVPGETVVEAMAQELLNMDEALKQLRYHLERAHDQIVKFANKKRRPATTKEGDWVYLKIRPHRQASMPTRLHPKLFARYYGPFQVTNKVRPVAFRVQLPEIARIHPIFHVSQLKFQ